MDIAEDTEHAAQKNEYTHTDPSGRPFILLFKHWLVFAGSNFSVIEGSTAALLWRKSHDCADTVGKKEKGFEQSFGLICVAVDSIMEEKV